MKNFLVYWKPKSVELLGEVLERAAGNQLGKVRSGDTLWIVSSSGGDLRLIGRITADRVVDQAEAERISGKQLWTATHHVLATKDTAMVPIHASISDIASRLRFSGSERDRLTVEDGTANPQQLQTLRTLTEESVALLTQRLLEASGGTAGIRARFTVGGTYSRADLYRIINVPVNRQGGDWDTGYHLHDDQWFVFCTLGPSRTGHEYGNRFEGDELVWYGKTGARASHPSIVSLTSGDLPVHVFFRAGDRQPFEYAGLGRAIETDAQALPVRVRWAFSEHPASQQFPEEVNSPQTYIEGAVKRIAVNAYERDRNARRACIDYYGSTCVACGFDFGITYGDRGRGYIHVHHLQPLATRGERYELDPIRDLRPLCPNCHAMIHATGDILSVDELKAVIENNRK